MARNETRVILSQPPAVPPQRRSSRRSSSGARAATDGLISAQWPRPHRRRGEETGTDSSSNPGRLSGAPEHRRQNIFRARPCAPWSSALQVEWPNCVPTDPRRDAAAGKLAKGRNDGGGCVMMESGEKVNSRRGC